MLNLKKSKVLVAWLLSYLAVVMLPLIIFLVNYSIYFEKLRSQSEDFNTYIADYTTNHIKDVIVDTRRLYADVTSHENLLPVLSITQPSEYLKNAETQSLLSYFEIALNHENKYTNFFLYIPETDYVLSPTGAVDSRAYFDAYFGGSDSEYIAWKDMFLLQKTGFFFNEIKSDKQEKNYILYRSVMPWEIRQYGHQAVFCALVEKDQFFQRIKEVQWLKSATIHIFDSGDRLLLSSANETEPPRTLHELMEGLTDEQAVLSKHIDFDTTNLNIVMVTDGNNLFAQAVSMRNLFLGSTIVCILSSVLLMLILIKQNYRPIREILGIMGNTGVADEFSEIKQFVRNGVLKDRKEQAAMKQMVLSHLVKGSYNRHYQQEDLGNCGIAFGRRTYLVLAISVKDFDKFTGQENEGRLKYFHELSFIITNVFEELYNNETSTAYVISVDEHFVCVINTDLIFESNERELVQLAEYGASVLNKEYELGLTFAFSRAHGSTEELAEAYREALYVLERRAAVGSFAVYPGNANAGGSEYYFNLDMEQKLIYYIQTKNQEMAETVIQNVFEFVEKSNEVSPEYVKCLLIDLALTLIKALGTGGGVQVFSQVFEKNLTAAQMKEWLLAEMRGYFKAAETESRKALEELILDYIYLNYQNPDLNVDYLSNHFNLSPYYLSKRFKSLYSESLIDFIHKFRLLEAKKQLRQGNKTIAAIAREVGYTNIRTFNRIFKKYEGVTPTQYQEQS